MENILLKKSLFKVRKKKYVSNLLINEILFNKKNKDLYIYYDVDFDYTYDFWKIFIDIILYSYKRNLYYFKKSFYKYHKKNIDDCNLFSEIEINILEYIDKYIENNINTIINELLIFLENDYYKKIYNISESSKLGLILYLFKYKNLNSLKRNYNFKLLQKIGILSIKKLKLKIEKEEWKDKKKRIEALNLELKLLKGIDKYQEISIAV